MAADVAVQETIIPVAVVVAMVFLAAATTVVFGLSCYPASVAETIMDAASFQCSGRCKNRPF